MNITKKILKSNFAKNVAWMSSGTAVTQILTIAFSPLITRLYLPEEMGVFALYSSTLGILLVFGTLKLENSIPIAKNDIIAVNALSLSMLFLLIISLFLGFNLILFGDTVLNYFNASELIPFKYLLPIGLFFSGTYLLLSQWALRFKRFKKLTYTKISQGIGLNLAQTSLGLLNFQVFGLVIGHIIGKSSGIMTLFRDIYKTKRETLSSISLKKMRWSLNRFKKFPIYILPSQLLSTTALELPVFFLSVFFGGEVVGQYVLANVIVGLPVTLIGTAVGDVYYSEAASKGKEDPSELLKLTRNTLKPLFLLGIIPMVIFATLSPYLFPLIFGDNWIDAGYYAQLIAALAFARLIFTPVFWGFIILEKHRTFLAVNILRITFVVASFVLSYYLELSDYYTILNFIILMIVVYLITYLTLIYTLKMEKHFSR